MPKLIHPLPPNEVRVPKGNGSDAEDIEEEPPTPHPLTDTWMQVRVRREASKPSLRNYLFPLDEAVTWRRFCHVVSWQHGELHLSSCSKRALQSMISNYAVRGGLRN